jgi:DNA polymerase elongation subunit (family B)
MKIPVSVIDLGHKTLLWTPDRQEVIEWPIGTGHYTFKTGSIPKSRKRKLRVLEQPKEGMEYEVTSTTYATVSRARPHWRFNYLNELMTTDHQWFAQQCSDTPPKVLTFDIETNNDSQNTFPRSDRNTILMIGYKMLDDDRVSILELDHPDDDDRELVLEFIDVIKQLQPDIICSYNGTFFDMPYIEGRLRYHLDGKIPDYQNHTPAEMVCPDHLKWIYAHAPGRPEWSNEEDWKEILFTYNIERLPGVYLHYDIYHTNIRHVTSDRRKGSERYRATYRDTSLTNLKDRTLKTVARHHHFDAMQLEEEEITNTNRFMKKDRKKFKEYLESDVLATEHLFKVYHPGNLELAEYLGVPLSVIVHREDGTVPSILMERRLKQKGYIAFKKNESKYPNYYSSSDAKGKFQAALVKCFNSGYHDKVYKIDFSSMYPSAMRTLNISPETVVELRPPSVYSISNRRLEGECLIEEERFKYRRVKNTRKLNIDGVTRDLHGKDFIVVRIPDEGFEGDGKGRLVYLGISQEKKGVAIEILEDTMDMRNFYKKKSKEAGRHGNDTAVSLYEARNQALKVINNSMFGFSSNQHSKYASVLVGIAITGFCRWLSNWVIEEYLSDCAIEVDTDGVLISKWVDVDKINKGIAMKLESLMDIPGENCYMAMELDEYEQGYVYAAKNYVLAIKKEDGTMKTEMHGNSFKSTRAPKLYDRAVAIMIDHILYGVHGTFEEAVAKAHSIENLPLDQFIQRINLSKDPIYYKDSTGMSWVYVLAETLNKRGAEIERGGQISYVQTRTQTGYTLASDAATSPQDYPIDYNAYHAIVERAVKAFGKEEAKSMQVV